MTEWKVDKIMKIALKILFFLFTVFFTNISRANDFGCSETQIPQDVEVVLSADVALENGAIMAEQKNKLQHGL